MCICHQAELVQAKASEVAPRLRLRSAKRQRLIVPRCRLSTYGRRAFSIAGPTVWNSVPGELRDPQCGYNSYKQFLKTIVFSLYSSIEVSFESECAIQSTFYLLTYLLTYLREVTFCGPEGNRIPGTSNAAGTGRVYDQISESFTVSNVSDSELWCRRCIRTVCAKVKKQEILLNSKNYLNSSEVGCNRFVAHRLNHR